MPYRQSQRKSQRKSRRKSRRSINRAPTLKRHGFRVVRHHAPNGKTVSVKNIRRPIAHLLPVNRPPSMNNAPALSMNKMPVVRRARVKRENQNALMATRVSIPRAAKAAQQERRNIEQAIQAHNREEREERKEQRQAHVSAMSNINALLSKMHI